MQSKLKLRRAVIATILLIITAYITVNIKNTIDSKDPEKSLPIISVSVGYNPPYVVRAGYTWKFGNKTVMSPYVDVSDAALMVTDAYPETNIVILLTAPEKAVRLYESPVQAEPEFRQISEWVTPKDEGKYYYRVEADFEDGNILYYFEIEVKKENLQS